jgi:hypothetical protein
MIVNNMWVNNIVDKYREEYRSQHRTLHYAPSNRN